MHDLATAQVKGGGTLLLAALQAWATNVMAFALIYCELDHGGPVSGFARHMVSCHERTRLQAEGGSQPALNSEKV
jgi:hypothetical protein